MVPLSFSESYCADGNNLLLMSRSPLNISIASNFVSLYQSVLFPYVSRSPIFLGNDLSWLSQQEAIDLLMVSVPPLERYIYKQVIVIPRIPDYLLGDDTYNHKYPNLSRPITKRFFEEIYGKQ